jgi:hypothetical protein
LIILACRLDIACHNAGKWRCFRIKAGSKYPAHKITFGNDSANFPVIIDNDDGADVSLRHSFDGGGYKFATKQSKGRRLVFEFGTIFDFHWAVP